MMVKKNGRYYWLKLKHDFFNKKEIKRLRRIAGGDTYTIIYLQMLLLSLESDGNLYFDNIGDDFIDELALELDEKPDDIKMTLSYLESKNMIEIISDDEYHLNEFPTMVGWESESRQRVRKHRAKKRLSEGNQELESVTSNEKSVTCNNDVTESNTEREIEKDKELEIEIDKDKEQEKDEDKKSYKDRVGVIFDNYTELGFGTINSYTAETFEKWLELFEPEVIIKALHVSSDNNVRKMSYVNAILKNWKNQGLFKIREIEADEQKREAEQMQPKSYQQKRRETPGEVAPGWMKGEKDKPKEKKPSEPPKTAADDPEVRKMIDEFRSKK